MVPIVPLVSSSKSSGGATRGRLNYSIPDMPGFLRSFAAPFAELVVGSYGAVGRLCGYGAVGHLCGSGSSTKTCFYGCPRRLCFCSGRSYNQNVSQSGSSVRCTHSARADGVVQVSTLNRPRPGILGVPPGVEDTGPRVGGHEQQTVGNTVVEYDPENCPRRHYTSASLASNWMFNLNRKNRADGVVQDMCPH
jgi:hypothetical protein